MPLSHRARKRWSLVALLVGMPLWVVAAVTVVGLFDRPPFWLEIVIYVGLGVIWIVPLKPLFLGVGQPDPDKGQDRP
ncbi:putative membrane channel-forming protein YqfA (hemolysin III family) [Roseovarius sp. MBR-78]|jgi:predicted membrane channel-forming protein YqfA (hemolysin III family)|uniref:DUF2842 domain-containing protein n=1 Tax=Roseovarius sp. MBR-78 TaxID=3156460 RepID=UPI003398081B